MRKRVLKTQIKGEKQLALFEHAGRFEIVVYRPQILSSHFTLLEATNAYLKAAKTELEEKCMICGCDHNDEGQEHSDGSWLCGQCLSESEVLK